MMAAGRLGHERRPPTLVDGHYTGRPVNMTSRHTTYRHPLVYPGVPGVPLWCTWCTSQVYLVYRGRHLVYRSGVPGVSRTAPGVPLWCTWCTALVHLVYLVYLTGAPGVSRTAPGVPVSVSATSTATCTATCTCRHACAPCRPRLQAGARGVRSMARILAHLPPAGQVHQNNRPGAQVYGDEANTRRSMVVCLQVAARGDAEPRTVYGA
jgi:hypothetical protein